MREKWEKPSDDIIGVPLPIGPEDQVEIESSRPD
jgi:hypothetical protein